MNGVYYSVNDVAFQSEFSETHIRSRCKDGRIIAWKLWGRWIIPASEAARICDADVGELSPPFETMPTPVSRVSGAEIGETIARRLLLIPRWSGVLQKWAEEDFP